MTVRRPPPGVVIVCDYFPPATRAGGPARTLLSIAQAEQHHAVLSVLTRDRDLGGGDSSPSPEDVRRIDQLLPEVSVHRLPRRGEKRTLTKVLRRSLAGSELLYLNSLLSPVYGIIPLALMRFGLVPRRPVLLAPRGELAAGALAIKRTKKRLVLPFLHRLIGRLDVTWHASSEREATDIRSFLGRTAQAVIVRTNPAPVPDAAVSRPDNDRLTIAFVGRMVPIKNFLLLAQAAAMFRFPARVVIAGSLEDPEYWKLCRAEVDRVPDHVTIEVRGHVGDHDVADLLRHADVMVLPTRGENFGRAIAEALAVGCPVMIPDTTMWTTTIRAGAGWVIDPDRPESLSALLEDVAHTDRPTLLKLRQRAHQSYSDWWADHQTHDRSLFQEVVSGPATKSVDG